MKCLHCQGEMKKGETPFHIDRKGCHLTLDRGSGMGVFAVWRILF